MILQKNTDQHRWNFSRFGGVTQVILKNADDITHLGELDQKLWTVLAMPTQGIFFDPKTISLLDYDGDGFIRPPEILATVDWLGTQLSDLSLLLEEGDSVPLASINDETLRASARWLLDHIQKNDTQEISIVDIETQKKFFDAHTPDCNAPIPADGSDDDKLKQIINRAVASCIENGTLADGIQQCILQDLMTDAQAFLAWQTSLAEEGILPLDQEHTQKAVVALSAIKEKAEDYFLRCTLTEYAPDKAAALSADEQVFQQLATESIHYNNEALYALPLAAAAADKPLPLTKGINPAWKAKLQTFAEDTVAPLLGHKECITQDEFALIVQKLTPYQERLSGKPTTPAALLSVPFLQALINGEKQGEVSSLIRYALTIEKERGNVSNLEKLVLLRRDFVTLLRNYISFSDFYEGKGSVFQAGVLYFDTRAADLCFELNGDARHATLDTLSGAYLVYCDISRKGETTKKIVALFTNGDSDNIVIGRNGIFYDRVGKDWNAVVTKVIANPISVRQAFFMPYKQLAAMIETQIAARAAAGEAKSADLLSKTASTVTTADKQATATAPAVAAPIATKKLDLGTIALIGTALGGISALIGSILQALFGLGFWVPLGLIGILLCISGPSMILASMKLRKRSIAPILEANGWAVNIRTRINIPFGTQLTKLSTIPFGSIVVPIDPFADKKNGRKAVFIILGILIVGTAAFCYLKFGLHFRFSEIPTYLKNLRNK
ncbi:hypothetical protein DWB79_09455 [Treponema medium]|uniref:EF-hand domain-containing protein n=2 Tax=Treponema medium TaxID=58231 RepID=A0AA87NL08_TREMD|nr:hypothetical protein [Treponema medium]EPF28173.1 hypothetical protein HMPREF9195_01865 [Treponema medium ATCC 700293]QSH97968.1 hypothetical protein DWB79_09455 [Treponema medium]